MSVPRSNTDATRQPAASLLSPIAYDDDAISLYSRSDQDTDSDDDQLQQAAKNSRELRAHDRIVLMEEEEMDRLVTDSRKKKKNKDRHRRGSGLAVPNPLNLLRRASLSLPNGPSSSADSSTKDLRPGKQHHRPRQQRRRRKREALMERAEHGEDGQLMYEMEEGGIEDGRSTTSDGDRDESDELDRQRLSMAASGSAQRRRCGRRWPLLHALVAVGLAILALLAWKLFKARRITHSHRDFIKDRFVSNGTALFGPTTLVISLDGFRADFLTRGLTPRLNAFVKEGISPKYMLPSFPSVTFPNHYTMATGLYPESHGIVGNTFWDPALEAEFYYTDPQRSLEPKWWGGEPFWVTAEKQGVRSAVHMWPGSEAHILNIEPSYLDKYNGQEKLENKVTRIMQFLDMPGKEDESRSPQDWRPQLIAAYVPNIDAQGHLYGPNSTEIRSTIREVDAMMDQIFHGLEARNLTDIVNVVVVSDHGMATTDRTRLLQLEELVDMEKIEHVDGWPLMGLRPKKADDTRSLYDGLKEKAARNPNMEVYLRDVDMPERYHFSKNERIAPLWIVPKTGWAIVRKEEFDLATAGPDEIYHPRGLHGYDNEHPLMRAIFIARGPAFSSLHAQNSEVKPFQNIELYNLVCDSVGIAPRSNNGTLRLPLRPVGVHGSEEVAVEEQDPVPTMGESVTEVRPVLTTTAVEASSSGGSIGISPISGTETEDRQEKGGQEKDGQKKDGQEKDGQKKDGQEKDRQEKNSEVVGWEKLWTWVKEMTNRWKDKVNSALGG